MEKVSWWLLKKQGYHALRSVMQLEAHLSTRLLNRTTRRLSITGIGRIYYEHSMSIL